MEPEEYCIIMKKKPAFLWENIIAGKKEKDGYIFLFINLPSSVTPTFNFFSFASLSLSIDRVFFVQEFLVLPFHKCFPKLIVMVYRI